MKLPITTKRVSERRLPASKPAQPFAQGAFIARNTVLMPSYANIGAYVDEGAIHG